MINGEIHTWELGWIWENTPGGQVRKSSPMLHLCRLSRVRRANVAFIMLVSRCMRSNVDLTYIAK
jgi:hypothetical protein